MSTSQQVSSPYAGELSPETVLVQAPQCIVRRQETQDLFYNVHTDEMHLVPKAGTYIYALCDGVTTIAQIEDAFCRVIQEDRSTVKGRLFQFLEQMVARGLLIAECPSAATERLTMQTKAE